MTQTAARSEQAAIASRSGAVTASGRLRHWLDVPIRYSWLTLLAPSLFSLKYLFWNFEPHTGLAGYAIAWFMFAVPFALGMLPLQLTYAHLPIRFQPRDLASLRAIPFHAVVIVFWAALGYALGHAIVEPLFPLPPSDPTGEWRELPFMAFLVTIVGTPAALRSIHMRSRLEESRLREVRSQREALAAQVQGLQARIEPHFLFNSLNSVASLIREDPERAERALERIAHLFRYALDASAAPFVPLADELESVECFLELANLRFEDRLVTSVSVEPGVGDIRVPPLALQPLVENAVQHGIATREAGGRVELEIRRGAMLEIRIEDDGPGPGGSSHRGAGAGLGDLRKRLDLLYGGRATLRVDRGELGGFRVRLALPLDAPTESEWAQGLAAAGEGRS